MLCLRSLRSRGRLVLLALPGSAASCRLQSTCTPAYTQGQSPQPRIREYFYYVDHQGQVSVYTYTLLIYL